MKVKSLILVLILFMACSCTAEVNLKISKDIVNESVDITVYQNAIYTKDILSTSFRNYIPVFAKDLIMDEAPDAPLSGILYYNKKTTDLGNGYRFNYSYDFNIDEYKEARTIKGAFRSYNIKIDNTSNTISISTDNLNLIYFDNYKELEEVKINIKTDYLVEETNADKVDGNTYTWVFNKDSKKSISMIINTSKVKDNKFEIINNKDLLIIISIITIIGIIFLLLFFKNKRNNKI